MLDLNARKPRPRIGLLPTGHFYYWDQFPGLKARGQKMYDALCSHLGTIGDVVAPEAGAVELPLVGVEGDHVVARRQVVRDAQRARVELFGRIPAQRNRRTGLRLENRYDTLNTET